MKTTTVSFPGLGLGEWTMDKVAFSLFGGVEVRWYGILLTSGIVLAFLYLLLRGKRSERLVADDIFDITIFIVVAGVIGARLYYVLTSPEQFHSFYDVIAIWNGGIAMYGSLIGGFVGGFIACLIKKVKWQKLADAVAPGILLAQSLGRWGNFVNGEAYGYQIVGGESRYYFFSQEFRLACPEGSFFDTFKMGLDKYGTHAYYHPTFLYESAWNLLGFVLLNIFYRRKRFDGQIFAAYLAWYGFGRMFIEGLRTDSLFIPGSELRISQLVGLACFVIGGLVCLLVGLCNRKNTPFASAAAEGAPAAAEEPLALAHESAETTFGRSLEKVFARHKKNEEDSNHGDEN